MAGRNLAQLSRSAVFAKSSGPRKPCIFLSHISLDKTTVKSIGDYIMDQGDLDIYLDIYDTELQKAVDEEDPYKITKFIEQGLSRSTHLMCLYSKKTVYSWWVPYEIGYAKKSDKKISSLKLKGEVQLPEYLKIGVVLKGTKSLNEYLKKISSDYSYPYRLVNESVISHSQSNHPLDDYLDWKK
ncbi:MAG: toll/interleukin-1 receptor domain-containing protein [Candidatus Electrothrix scaldis]|nr:MAG: toll/interleukin-1 receptor domain-containing protein [Candidatus Electrothrix sp. GW3-3]